MGSTNGYFWLYPDVSGVIENVCSYPESRHFSTDVRLSLDCVCFSVTCSAGSLVGRSSE
jgi:hypothetical protein